MSNKHNTDIYIVGVNIDKMEAHQMAKLPLKTGVYRVAHGVYFVAKKPSEAVFRRIFERYAFRICVSLFPDSGLTHSTAYYMKPTSSGLVFIGGAYSYRRQVAEGYGDFTYIQSPISISRQKRDKASVLHVLEDSDLFEPVVKRDKLGSYTIRAQTPEFMLLTQFEIIKEYKEKLLPPADLAALLDLLLVKHGGRKALIDHIKMLSERAGKDGEFSRFYQYANVTL